MTVVERPSGTRDAGGWVLAAGPLIGVAIGVAALRAMRGRSVADVWVLALAVNLVLVALDAHRLRRAGLPAPSPPYQVVVPAYVVQRTRCLHQHGSYTVVWVVALAAAVVLSSPLTRWAAREPHTALDMDKITRAIQDKLAATTGRPATVHCPPAEPSRPGVRFSCQATGPGGPVESIEVTVQDTQGDIVWRLAASGG